MRRYTPFLKLKSNEIGALEVLDPSVLKGIRPFFDVARKKEMTAESACSAVVANAKKLRRVLKELPFFIDTFDVPDGIEVNGDDLFRFIVEQFEGLNYIPVVGVDRSQRYISAVMEKKKDGGVEGRTLAVRLLEPEFESFPAIADELQELLTQAIASGYEQFVVVVDCRYCLPADPGQLGEMITKFLSSALAALPFDEAIVTGSSIPMKISEVLDTDAERDLLRVELQVFESLATNFDELSLGFGDYTIVSPYYSELDLPPEMLPNVTAPKVLYTHGEVHFGARGNALKSHPRGNLQYNDIAAALVGKDFFRLKGYSWGEDFLVSKANGEGKLVTPGSILKPTICTHITYMAKDHPLFA